MRRDRRPCHPPRRLQITVPSPPPGDGRRGHRPRQSQVTRIPNPTTATRGLQIKQPPWPTHSVQPQSFSRRGAHAAPGSGFSLFPGADSAAARGRRPARRRSRPLRYPQSQPRRAPPAIAATRTSRAPAGLDAGRDVDGSGGARHRRGGAQASAQPRFRRALRRAPRAHTADLQSAPHSSLDGAWVPPLRLRVVPPPPASSCRSVHRWPRAPRPRFRQGQATRRAQGSDLSQPQGPHCMACRTGSRRAPRRRLAQRVLRPLAVGVGLLVGANFLSNSAAAIAGAAVFFAKVRVRLVVAVAEDGAAVGWELLTASVVLVISAARGRTRVEAAPVEAARVRLGT